MSLRHRPHFQGKAGFFHRIVAIFSQKMRLLTCTPWNWPPGQVCMQVQVSGWKEHPVIAMTERMDFEKTLIRTCGAVYNQALFDVKS